jgi:cytochrome P450
VAAPARALPPRFDAFDLARVDDPYPVYAQLRAVGPLHRGGPGQWLVPGYADVLSLLRDRRLGQFQFRDAYEPFPPAALEQALGDGPAAQLTRRIVVGLDRPEHARLRGVVGRAFRPEALAALRERFAERVDRTLAQLEEDFVDVVPSLAFPLPMSVITELVGIPAADGDEVGAQALRLNRIFAPVLSEADRAAADEAVVWLRDYVGELARGARAPARDGLLAAMLEAERRGTLSREELVDNVIFVVFAGLETSMNLIASACALLAQHPHELRRLRARRSFVPAAVEEVLRFDAPTQITARIALEPLEVAGRSIRRGRVVLLLLGSANRDERRFADPDRLAVDRSPNPHLSFGAGPHFCAGAGLARMEASVVLERLLERFASLEAAGRPVRERGATLRAFLTVPLRMKRSPRARG